MKQEEIKNEKLEQVLNDEDLDNVSGGRKQLLLSEEKTGEKAGIVILETK